EARIDVFLIPIHLVCVLQRFCATSSARLPVKPQFLTGLIEPTALKVSAKPGQSQWGCWLLSGRQIHMVLLPRHLPRVRERVRHSEAQQEQQGVKHSVEKRRQVTARSMLIVTVMSYPRLRAGVLPD